MGQLIADIFITTKGRPELLRQTLSHLKQNTDRSQYRLTVVDDGSGWSTHDVTAWNEDIDHLLYHRENLGLGPSINQALAHIDALDRYYPDPPPFVCYLQDDVLVSKDWLPKMTKFFLMFEKRYNLGFASGIECVEHAVKKDLGNGMILKDWVRAANMFGRREYWMSMYPIPRIDPETGRVRAKPNDGRGSGVDWWFVRTHENSVCRTGRTNLVFPGMMVHAGYDKSTWLNRELPESEADKRVVARELPNPDNMHGAGDGFGGSDF